MNKPYRKHGLAMILVLGVVATASILAYAMLASAAMQAQVSKSLEDRVQRKYLTESGLNLALYYLQTPSASPVSLVYGTYGNVHYPGETEISLTGMDGTLTISVTNTSNGNFDIVSIATLNGVKTIGRAKVKLNKSKTFANAGNFKGNITLSALTVVTGGLITDGSVSKGAATVVGSITASNGSSFIGGTNYSGSAMNYPMTALSYMPYYFFNGNRYTAKSLGTSYTGGTLFDTDTANNPANVWYSSGGTTFTGTTTLNGTLIVPNNKDATISGLVTITPASNLPAAVLGRKLIISGGLRSFTANGVTYLGDVIKGSGLVATSTITINGALVSSLNGIDLGDNYNGAIALTYNSSKNKISGFADQMENVDSVEIKQWQIDNTLPN